LLPIDVGPAKVLYTANRIFAVLDLCLAYLYDIFCFIKVKYRIEHDGWYNMRSIYLMVLLSKTTL